VREELTFASPRPGIEDLAAPKRAAVAAPPRIAPTRAAERPAGGATIAAAASKAPADGAADQPPRIGQGAAANPAPEYPEEARLRGWHGRVVLAVIVSPEGGVASIRVRSSSGHPLLDEAALRAVRRWRFEPGRRAGQAVAAAAEVPIRFRLTD
jgi:protein TonB